LAIRLVVAKPESGMPVGWIHALQGIRETALREHAAQTAAAAGAAVEADPSGFEEALADLQAALERDSHARAGQLPSAAQASELLSDFVLESGEHLAAVESQVLQLEREPHDAEALNAVFRGFHTIKGLAGFLELWEVQKVAHETEAVLD